MKKLEWGDYGAVYVIKGKHAGKVGYYDDDIVYIKEEAIMKSMTDDEMYEETDDLGTVGAVVYFGQPFQSKWQTIPLTHLLKIEENDNIKNLDLEVFKKKFPDLAYQLNVCS